MLAGASMANVSKVLYLKVLQWAGYSEDLKVAELERMLEMDEKLGLFSARAKVELDGIEWTEVRNQPLVANQIAARLANEFYPKLFRKPEDFQNIVLKVSKSEFKRAEEMIELVRRKSGKKNIFFIVDEVGQYVSAKADLILNLDGLAKNLKQIGNGSVWLFATAQQTLTEDNASAMINAASLFKLKDRFPDPDPFGGQRHQGDLPQAAAHEIRSRRRGTESLFDTQGASLRTATQLKDGGVYEAALGKRTFTDLYPFLPAHFEILLHLARAIGQKDGGTGAAFRDQRLCKRCWSNVPAGAEDRRLSRCRGRRACEYRYFLRIATEGHSKQLRAHRRWCRKCVNPVSQPTASFQVSRNRSPSFKSWRIFRYRRITSLRSFNRRSVTVSRKEEVEKVIECHVAGWHDLLGEKEWESSLSHPISGHPSEGIRPDRVPKSRCTGVFNGVLRSIFKPLPSARLSGVRPVTAGLKIVGSGGQLVSLRVIKKTFNSWSSLSPGNYEAMRIDRENDSRSRKERANIFLLGRIDPDAEQLAIRMVRCRKFLDQHRTASDPETQEFVRIVDEAAEYQGYAGDWIVSCKRLQWQGHSSPMVHINQYPNSVSTCKKPRRRSSPMPP